MCLTSGFDLPSSQLASVSERTPQLRGQGSLREAEVEPPPQDVATKRPDLEGGNPLAKHAVGPL